MIVFRRLADLEERKKRLEEIKKKRQNNTLKPNSDNTSQSTTPATVDDILKQVSSLIEVKTNGINIC